MPLFLVHTLWRASRDGGKVYLQQRLGLSSNSVGKESANTDKCTLWIHAASVGEVNTVMPLLQAIADRHPDDRLLVTTNTPTGKQTLQKAAESVTGQQITHSYLPIDYRFTLKRFLTRINPSLLIVVETEIWPKLYQLACQRDLPIVIVNGRISAKTARVKDGFLASTYSAALQAVSLVLARSDADAVQYQSLSTIDGQSSTLKVKVPGNLKNLTQQTALENASTDLLNGRDFCLLASTHDSEELDLTREWMTRNRGELLVIVPRHPDRSAKLTTALGALTNHLAVRSRGEMPGPETRVYLADTLGELQGFMAHAKAVFVGGSIAPIGGHNILEPARAGCAIVVGPDMSNFRDELALLKEHDAVVQATNIIETIDTLCFFLDEPEQAMALGNRARMATRELAAKGETMLQCYLDELEPWLS